MDRQGTSRERAESEPPYRRGAQSESEMAGTPIMWAPGTLSRSISSARHSRAAVSLLRHLVGRRNRMAEKGSQENHSACTAAYWHQPTFSAADSLTEEGITSGTWWQLLYDAGADLVLNGHDHLYARYAPVRPSLPSGTSDPNRGIREFIVGTGGETLIRSSQHPPPLQTGTGRSTNSFSRRQPGTTGE